MTKQEWILISKWLAEKIIYLLVLFFVFVGMMFSIASKQARELRLAIPPVKLPTWISFVIHSCSYSLTATIMAFAIDHLHVNVWLMCFLGGFMGMGANTTSNWIHTLWTSSETPTDFFKELTKWFRAFWAGVRAAQGKNNNDTNTQRNE